MVKLDYEHYPKENPKYRHCFYLYRDDDSATIWSQWLWFGLGNIFCSERKFLLYPWEKTWDTDKVERLGEWQEIHSAIKVADWISRKIKRKLK